MSNSVLDWIEISETEREEREVKIVEFRSLFQNRFDLQNSKLEDIVNPNMINILIDTGFAWEFVYPTLTFINNWKGFDDVQLYTIAGLKTKKFEMVHRINNFYRSFINRDIIKVIPSPKGNIDKEIPIGYKKIFDKMDHYLMFAAVLFAWVGKHKRIFDYFRENKKRTMYIGFDDLIPTNQKSFVRYADVSTSVNCKSDQTTFEFIKKLNKNSYYHPHTVDTDMFVPQTKIWDFQLLHSFEPHRVIKKNKKGNLTEVKLNKVDAKRMERKALTSDNFYRDYRIIDLVFALPGNNLRGGYFWDSFPTKPGDNWTSLDDYKTGMYNLADWTNTMDLFGKSKYAVHLYRKVHENASYFYTERPILSFASGCIIFADELGNNEFLSQHNIKWGENIFRITHETSLAKVEDMIVDIDNNYESIIESTRRIGLWWDYRNWSKRFREIIFEAQPGDSFECPPIKN